MKLLTNTGPDRVIDELRSSLQPAGSLDIATPEFSLFAFAELRDALQKLDRRRIVVPSVAHQSDMLLGTDAGRSSRNRLQARWLARACAAWLETRTEVRAVPGPIPQSTLCVGTAESNTARVITGTCSFTTHGLGLAPAHGLKLIQVAETTDECALLGGWFGDLWNRLPASAEPRTATR